MPFNGVGVFQRVYQWVQDAANGIFVDATRTDTDSNDIAAGLTNCVTRDGQSTWLANLPAGGFKITGMAVGSAVSDSVNYGQVFNSPAFVTPSATTSPPNGNNSLLLATTAFAQQLAFQTALPAQSLGLLISSGTVASFSVTFTGFAVNEVKGADIASAATINLTTSSGNFLHITGTVGINAITIPIGATRTTIFDGILTLTNSAALNLWGTNITTAPGDRSIWRGDTAGAVLIGYSRADGSIVVPATSAEVKTGTSSKAVTPAGLLGGVGFSAFFESANQNITSGGSLTIAHSLGRKPVLVQAYLRNTTAELGYSIGDELLLTSSNHISGGAAGYGVAIVPDTTNLVARYGSLAQVMAILNKSDGTGNFITAANWRLFLRAWA